MSEEERKQRIGYRKKRKKYITVITSVLVAFVIFTLVFAALAVLLNKTYYVNYTEKSSVDYGVHLKDNEFYEESFLGKDYAYIATLIDGIEATFDYGMDIDSESDVDFSYTYRIDSLVTIRDRSSGKVLYAPKFNEIPEKSNTVSGNAVSVKQTVFIDYNKYNEIATKFLNAYKPSNVDVNLQVQMIVSVKGVSDEFQGSENNNSYISSISIPLTANTVEVKITSAIPATDQKILSYTTEGVARILGNLAKIFLAISVLIAICLWIYVYFSRNVDITYDIKVKRLLSKYKSFIQRLKCAFDTTGYQILPLATFNEMLDIRDTIQSPILMFENKDKTCTTFVIPTNTKILYLFDIKTDDYDEIYNTSDDTAPGEPAIEEVIDEFPVEDVVDEFPVEDVVDEFPVEDVVEQSPVEDVVEQSPVEEIVETAAAEEISEVAAILDNIVEAGSDSNESENADEEAVLAYFDGEGNTVRITCARSFTANLIQSNPQIKEYYNEIKNYILSFKGVKARTSWRYEAYKKGRIQLFKMKIRGKMICLYCALDPNDYDSAKYFHEATDSKAFASVPMMVRIKSNRGLKRAKALVDDVMARFFILPNDKAETVDYVKDYPYDTTKNLVERKLIKLLLPDAVAAEPKPHHHVHKKTVNVVHEDVVEQIVVFDADKVDDTIIEEIALEPTPELDKIDYDDKSEEIGDFVETEDHPGIDVIGVVWPERSKRNKIYRYDPDGETVSAGDVVIVPTRDESRQREVIRKAAVAHSNHKVAPEELKHPLKKIMGVIRTKKNETADTKNK